MTQNSFAMKAGAVAFVSALFGLSLGKDKAHYVLIALVPAMAFWGLDSYYLRQERLFRALYDAVRSDQLSAVGLAPFSMEASRFANDVPGWWTTCWSVTTGWLYAPMVVLIVGASRILR